MLSEHGDPLVSARAHFLELCRHMCVHSIRFMCINGHAYNRYTGVESELENGSVGACTTLPTAGARLLQLAPVAYFCVLLVCMGAPDCFRRRACHRWLLGVCAAALVVVRHACHVCGAGTFCVLTYLQ